MGFASRFVINASGGISIGVDAQLISSRQVLSSANALSKECIYQNRNVACRQYIVIA